MAMLKFISINTRGLNSKEKRDKFYSWIIDTNIDVILIQETHCVEKNPRFFITIMLGKEHLYIAFLTNLSVEAYPFCLKRV